MATHRQSFTVKTKGETHAVDITAKVAKAVQGSGIREGIACVFVAGSTAAIVANEYEPGLMEADLPAAFERFAPRGPPYEHGKRWGDDNGRSHVRATVLGPSLAVPVADGAPMLGTWQQLVLFELDTRGRTREVYVQVVGE